MAIAPQARALVQRLATLTLDGQVAARLLLIEKVGRERAVR